MISVFVTSNDLLEYLDLVRNNYLMEGEGEMKESHLPCKPSELICLWLNTIKLFIFRM